MAMLEPENVAKMNAQIVRFPCSFSGTPTPKLDWYKDGEPLNMDDDDKHLLKILNAEPADSGYYQCLAQNEAGESSMISHLLVFSTGRYSHAV